MVDQVVRKDDLDGTTEAVERIYFSVHGKSYEIDLSAQHIEEFEQALDVYTKNARADSRQPAPTSTRGRQRQTEPAKGRSDIPQIRQWAEAQGIDVSTRGRIRQDIIDAYDRAQQQESAEDSEQQELTETTGGQEEEAGVQEEHESTDER